jgi:hypothetical protein
VDAARGDLADIRLADRIFAPHYAAAVLRTVIAQTPLVARVGGDPLSEVLEGEPFEVLELAHGHAWGVSPVDGAVGFVAADALGPYREATHIVAASAPGGSPIGARLTAEAPGAIPMTAPIADFVDIAEQLVGVPERRGGRSGEGCNCTGLIFLALSLAGIRAPRFADLQARALGHTVADEAPMLRGDLLFYADHAAIVVDSSSAIHVDGGAVTRTMIDAITGYGPLVVRRRLP